MNVNVLDWCLLAFLAASMLLGFLRGGTKEVLGLGGWIGGLVFAFLGAPLLAPLLVDWLGSANMRWLASFIVIYIAVRIVAWALGKLLTELIAAAKLGVLDKITGLLFGVFRAVVVTLALAFVCMTTRVPQTNLWLGSYAAPIIQQYVHALVPFLPADAQRWLQK